MELIVQKCCGAWDLCGSPGLHEAVCGEAGCEKGAKKVERWNTIAASAAKQSGRGIIPEVMSVKTYKRQPLRWQKIWMLYWCLMSCAEGYGPHKAD